MLGLLLLLYVSDFPEGVRAFQEGRFGDALEAFTEAEEAQGDQASAALLHNKALAALRAGRLSDAEASAEKAAAAGGPELFPFRDFLQGNAAFARAEHAERQASQPEAEPFAYDLAIAYAEKAGRSWQRAAASRPDWPEARRNVERALLKVESLKKKKKAAAEQRRKLKDQRKEIILIDPNLAEGEEVESGQEIKVAPQLQELPPELVLRLLDVLKEKEKEKRDMRRARQRIIGGDVEKDW